MKGAKYIFLIFFIGLFNIFFPFIARADLAPRIYVSNLNVSEVDGNKISGEFTVSNNEQYYLGDLNYEIKLLQGTSIDDFRVIDTLVVSDVFSIPQTGKIVKKFVYYYPQNIASGSYTLRAQVITARGTELGWDDQVVSLTGSGVFLEIYSPLSGVSYDSKKYPPLFGVSIPPDRNVDGLLRVINPGEAVTVVPRIRIFQREVNMPVVKEYQDSPISFTKEETKDIALAMPVLTTPDSYLAEVKFYKDGEQVSIVQYFRWVVEGSSGKIIYVKIDKDYYKAGENINLIIESVGPADNSDIGNGKLQITVFDKNGNLIAETSKDVQLNFSLVSSEIAIPVKEDLVSPIINVELIKGEKLLDKRNVKISPSSEEARKLGNKIFIKTSLLFYVLPVLLVLIILVVGFFLYKSKIGLGKWKR